MRNNDRADVTLLKHLLDWYDRDEASDDDLERVICQARNLVQQCTPDEPVGQVNATSASKYVLYDFDRGELFSTDVYANYADGKADAEGLNNVLILKLPIPVLASKELEITDDNDPRCDCELPGFFCCGVPGILAHLERGRVAPRAKVERCDQCQRYESDEAARQKLIELEIL